MLNKEISFKSSKKIDLRMHSIKLSEFKSLFIKIYSKTLAIRITQEAILKKKISYYENRIYRQSKNQHF